jgi:hypothetical protein
MRAPPLNTCGDEPNCCFLKDRTKGYSLPAWRTSMASKVGQHWANLYADFLTQIHGQCPLLFYTNDFETWL